MLRRSELVLLRYKRDRNERLSPPLFPALIGCVCCFSVSLENFQTNITTTTTITEMDSKEAKIYCLNRNCSLFEKDLAAGSADAAFIFCPRCTRKLYKEENAKKRNKQPQTNRANNNSNTNHSIRSRSYQNTNRKQQNPPSAPPPHVTISGQPDPTVVMLFEKMLNIISTSVKYDS